MHQHICSNILLSLSLTFDQGEFKMRLRKEIELSTGLAFTGSFGYRSNSIIRDYLQKHNNDILMIWTRRRQMEYYLHVIWYSMNRENTTKSTQTFCGKCSRQQELWRPFRALEDIYLNLWNVVFLTSPDNKVRLIIKYHNQNCRDNKVKQIMLV